MQAQSVKDYNDLRAERKAWSRRSSSVNGSENSKDVKMDETPSESVSVSESDPVIKSSGRNSNHPAFPGTQRLYENRGSEIQCS